MPQFVSFIIVLFNPMLFSEVWARFLQFESISGDLASLVKVEKRKLEAYKEVRNDQIAMCIYGVW